MLLPTSARKGAAAAAIIATGALGVAGVSASAFAADDGDANQGTVQGADQQNADIALIKKEATVELDIHKYLGGATGNANNGTLQSVTGRPTLAGVNFNVLQVQGVDLTTNAGWNAANDLAGVTLPKAAKAGSTITGKSGTAYTLGAATTVTTDGNGVATFTKAKGVGLYLVEEDIDGSGAITASDGTTITKSRLKAVGANPFLVTLPMTNPDARTSWMYEVHVYPKNQQAEAPRKDVKDGNVGTDGQSAVKVGDTLTYDVYQQAPDHGDVVGPIADGVYTAADGKIDHNDLPYFIVTDTFDSNLEAMAVKSVYLDGAALTATTDYTVSTSGQTVTVTFTNAGLDKIAAAAHTGGKGVVQVEYTAKVKSVPDSGVIPNEANVKFPDAPNQGDATPSPEDNPGNDTPTVQSKYGRIKLTKTAPDGTPLNGATFSVYRATKSGDGDSSTYSCVPVSKATVLDTLSTSGGTDTSVALELSNWYNDGVEKASGGNRDGYLDGGQYAAAHGDLKYCLAETKAPSGYQLLADPILFDLTREGLTVADVVTGDYLKDSAGGNALTVVDQPDNLTNKLPLTGGEGVAFLSIAGIVLVGGGVGYYSYTQRKRREDA